MRCCRERKKGYKNWSETWIGRQNENIRAGVRWTWGYLEPETWCASRVGLGVWLKAFYEVRSENNEIDAVLMKLRTEANDSVAASVCWSPKRSRFICRFGENVSLNDICNSVVYGEIRSKQDRCRQSRFLFSGIVKKSYEYERENFFSCSFNN